MKVRLGTFARSTIETEVGVDLVTGTQAALHHYTRRLRSGRPPAPFPRFCRGESFEGTVLEVPVDPRIEESLNHEVRRQGATLEQMISHAVLVYLADLERGSGPGIGQEVMS
jgi:hypothetical protein